MMTLKIEGMTCAHCVQSVTKVLSAIPNVERVVTVDLTRGDATLAGSPDPDAVVHSLAKAGFVARLTP